MRTVVLYGREGCCLCDDARAVLKRVRVRRPFVLQDRDIDRDEALLRAYLERIPVVTIDGIEAFELFVDEPELERRLAEAPPSGAPEDSIRCTPDELHGR
jgi:glutaredoxin